MNTTDDRCGFTLLELLVAVGITAALAALMLTVIAGTLKIWQRTQSAFSAETQAKLVLDHLERDLQGAIFREDGGTWMRVDVINDAEALAHHGWLTSPAMKPASGESQRLVPEPRGASMSRIADARFGLSGAWLRMITTNVEAGGSLPVAAAYQMARRPITGAVSASNPAAVRYSLFRSAVSPENTFGTGYDLAVGYGSTGRTPPAQRSPGTIANPNTTGDTLATNVVDFGAWLHARSATGELMRIFPAANGDVAHSANSSATFPAVVDVMVRILSEEGANLLERIEAGDASARRPPAYASDGEWWWSVVEANSRVFTRRIEVKARVP